MDVKTSALAVSRLELDVKTSGSGRTQPEMDMSEPLKIDIVSDVV